MKKKILILFVFALIFAGCQTWGVRGNGVLKVEERKISDFSKLEISGVFAVKIVNGKKPSLKIRAEENLLKYIVTEVEDGTLEIYTRKRLSPRKRLMIKVTVPHLLRVESSGVNRVYVVNLHEKKFRVEISGASEVKLCGKVGVLNAEVSGASSLEAEKLTAEKARLEISGASDACVNVRKTLSAEVSGASELLYLGSPEKLDLDVSGASHIKKKSTGEKGKD